MGFPTKVLLIRRKDSQQRYINFPSAVAQSMEFTRGAVVEWIVEDKNRLFLRRRDPTLSPQQILQTYLWRWEIELNFRDEKTLLGFGQPQVRGDPAVRTTATFFVFAYALLLLALENSHLAHSPLPRPRWQRLRPRRPPIPESPLHKPSRCCAPTSGPPRWVCQIKTASLHQMPVQRSHSSSKITCNPPFSTPPDSQTRGTLEDFKGTAL